MKGRFLPQLQMSSTCPWETEGLIICGSFQPQIRCKNFKNCDLQSMLNNSKLVCGSFLQHCTKPLDYCNIEICGCESFLPQDLQKVQSRFEINTRHVVLRNY